MSTFYPLSTIGQLRAALTALPDHNKRILINGAAPTALSSYRGYYDHLAIERGAVGNPMTKLAEPSAPFESDFFGTYTPGSTEVQIKEDPTVGDLIEALNLASGATFEGYKGGQFTMHEDSDIWVSEYGQCQRLRICRIREGQEYVDIDLVEVAP